MQAETRFDPQAIAAELRASLDTFHLPHRIEPVPSRGSWVANTGLKARIVEAAWHESERPVCWIDADAAMLRQPTFLMGNPFDIAFVRRKGWEDLSGLIYLNKTEAAGRVLACEPIPGFLLDMVEAGGLLPQLKQRLERR